MKTVNLLLDTPLGWLEVSGNTSEIHQARWVLDDDAVIGSGLRSVAWKHAVEQQVARYFEGDLDSFDLPLAFHTSEAQQITLKAISEIPRGNVIDVETFIVQKRLDNLRMSDVMYAIGGNPFPLLIPSHRVALGQEEHAGLPLEQINKALRESEKQRLGIAS
jgi:O6-methylguanine-DNA--protein-cysteine methyltransferase